MKVKIDEIIIGKRIRRETGELEPLIESIRRHGLLNPVTLTRDKRLIAGYRRIKAAKSLGWEEIECHYLDADSKLDLLMIEAEENMTRRDFSREEILYFEEIREYLNAKGLRKFILWIKLLLKRISERLEERFGSS